MHTVWAQAHGDSQCDRSGGWTSCLLQTQPHGYALELLDSLDMDADLVDSRPAGIEEMVFYAEAAIELLPSPAESATVPLNLLSIGNPFRFNETLASQRVQGAQLYFPYRRRIDNYLVLIPIPPCVWRVFVDLCSYPPGVYALCLGFATSPESIGLNQDKWTLRRPWDPLPISSLGFTSPNDVIEHLKRQPGASEPKCVYSAHIDGRIKLGDDWWDAQRRMQMGLLRCRGDSNAGMLSPSWLFRQRPVQQRMKLGPTP